MITDSAVLWTYSRMIEKTEPYCHIMWFDPPIDVLGIMCNGGWYMSELAEEDLYKYLCLN